MRRVLLRRLPIRQCLSCFIGRTNLRPASQQFRRVVQHQDHQSRRMIHIPNVLLPPVVFTGLLVALWTWKCFMMVVFQNKIIFMPGLPPNARQERIENYKTQCGGIEWREEKITAADGTKISLCVASVDSGLVDEELRDRVYILYFQGNASSIPPRLPFLSPVLRVLRDAPSRQHVRYILVCCSYRGYWTSRGRPSEKGIAQDALAALEWIRAHSSKLSGPRGQNISVVIWGQSIGAGVATSVAAHQSWSDVAFRALILETPFLSVRAMLETLYPQRWLPYRYLWPFLRTHFDSWSALGLMCQRSKRLGARLPDVLLLMAGKDELVPSSQGDKLEQRCIELGFPVTKKVISGALHTEVMIRPEGRLALVDAIQKSLIRTSEVPESNPRDYN